MLKKLFISWKNKLPVLLLILLGYTLCITIVSMMANQIVLDARIRDNMNLGDSDKRSMLSVTSDYNTDFNGDPINVIEEFSKYGKVDVLRLGKDSISSEGNEAEAQICPVLFHETTDWTPQLAQGRYLSPEECSKGADSILIGKNVASKLKAAVGSTVNFYGKEFKVIGILGPRYIKDQWDNVASVSFRALPREYMDSMRQTLVDKSSAKKMLKLQMVLRVKQDKFQAAVSSISDEFRDYNLKIDKIDTGDWHNSPMGDIIATVIVSIPIMVVAVFNVVNISFFWIMDRKKEITIKKALGAANRFIIAAVRKEMIIIGVIAAILSLALQNICVASFEPQLNGAGLSLQVSWVTFLISAVTALFLGYMASVLPAKKIVAMEPAEALRYE